MRWASSLEPSAQARLLHWPWRLRRAAFAFATAPLPLQELLANAGEKIDGVPYRC
jgi:hypothetical protein